MYKLSDKRLEKITGGEVSVMVYLIATTIVVFISGILDGYTNPKKCGE